MTVLNLLILGCMCLKCEKVLTYRWKTVTGRGRSHAVFLQLKYVSFVAMTNGMLSAEVFQVIRFQVLRSQI